MPKFLKFSVGLECWEAYALLVAQEFLRRGFGTGWHGTPPILALWPVQADENRGEMSFSFEVGDGFPRKPMTLEVQLNLHGWPRNGTVLVGHAMSEEESAERFPFQLIGDTGHPMVILPDSLNLLLTDLLKNGVEAIPV